MLQHLHRRLLAGGAPQQGPTTGHQLPHAEGFDQVVVGPHLQAEHPIGFAIAGAHHQDRGLVVGLAQLAAHIQASQARQHQIQHHQRKPLALGGPLQNLQGIPAITAGDHRKALLLQGIAHRFADGFVVFDDQERWLHRPSLPWNGLAPKGGFSEHVGAGGRSPGDADHPIATSLRP